MHPVREASSLWHASQQPSHALGRPRHSMRSELTRGRREIWPGRCTGMGNSIHAALGVSDSRKPFEELPFNDTSQKNIPVPVSLWWTTEGSWGFVSKLIRHQCCH